MLNGTNWSWHIYTVKEFKNQLHKVFSDKDITYNYGIDPDMFVVTSPQYMGIAELINKNIYTANTSYSIWLDSNSKEPDYQERLENTSIAYDIHSNTFNDVSTYIETLNSNALYMSDIMPISVGAGDYYLVNVDHTGTSDLLNEVWISNEGYLEIASNTVDETILSFIGGRFYDWETAPKVLIKISEFDENGNQNELATLSIDNQKVQKYEIPLKITANSIIVSVFGENGIPIDADNNDPVFMINWKLK